MAVTIQTQRTKRFVEPWLYVALGAAALVFLAWVISGLFQKTLVSQTVSASTGEPVQLEPIQLKPQLVGAWRIDVKALFPTNQWVTYEIQIQDQQGEIIASAVKQAWKESGTWYEDGESGTWYEQDVLGGLDVRAKNRESVTITIAVLEYGETNGQALDGRVAFRVTVQNGVVDRRYFLPGIIGTVALAVMASLATGSIGEKAIAKSIPDSDPSDRGTVGGGNRLVRVDVKVRSDETSPRQLDIRLRINDAYGERIYLGSFPTSVGFRKKDKEVVGATAKLRQFFLLEPRSSYGFQVEVFPDAPVDETTLTVRDGARTRCPVEVVKISPSPVATSNYSQDR
jgi:hypothetical protein